MRVEMIGRKLDDLSTKPLALAGVACLALVKRLLEELIGCGLGHARSTNDIPARNRCDLCDLIVLPKLIATKLGGHDLGDEWRGFDRAASIQKQCARSPGKEIVNRARHLRPHSPDHLRRQSGIGRSV